MTMIFCLISWLGVSVAGHSPRQKVEKGSPSFFRWVRGCRLICNLSLQPVQQPTTTLRPGGFASSGPESFSTSSNLMTSPSPFQINPVKDALLRISAVVGMVILYLALLSLLSCISN